MSFNIPIILGANVRISGLTPQTLKLHSIDLNGFNVDFDVPAPVAGQGDGFEVRAVTGHGTVVKSGPGMLRMVTATYTGPTIVQGGGLYPLHAGSLGAAGEGNETFVVGGFIRLGNTSYEETFNIAGRGPNGEGVFYLPQDMNGRATLLGPVNVLARAEIGASSTCKCSIRLAGPVTGGELVLRRFTEMFLAGVAGWSSLVVDSEATAHIERFGGNALPSTGDLDVRGRLFLSGSESIRSLMGGGFDSVIEFVEPGTLTINQMTDESFTGKIVDAQAIVKKGPKRLELVALAPHFGTTTVEEGLLRLTGGTIAGPVIVNGGTLETTAADNLVDLTATVAVNAPGAWTLSANDTIASLTGNGRVTLVPRANSTRKPTLQLGANNLPATFTGTIDGDGGSPALVKVGTGTLTMTGTHTYTGGTRVAAGTLLLTGGLNPAAPVAVDGGMLAGAATIGSLTGAAGATSGVVSPGASPGLMTAGAASIGGPLVMELNSAVPGTGFDQLALSGDLTFTARASLQLSLGFRPRQGTQFPIVTLPAGKTVSGIFAGLPEGGTFSLEGRLFGITYHGGDEGNDIVLTALDTDGNVPTITITAPTTASAFTANTALIALAGQAADGVGLTRVVWESDRGGRGVATGTTAWSVPAVSIAPGTNVITVTAFNSDGYAATAQLTVTLDTLTYYLAEGATSDFFATDLLIANPNDTAVPAVVRYLRSDGSMVTQQLTLVPTSQQSIAINAIPGMEGAEFSTTVESPDGHPLIVERTMRWGAGGYGAHTERAADAPASRWYFAEGAQGFYQTYVLLANPSAAPNRAVVEFLLEGAEPVTRNITLGPTSRVSLHAGALPELTAAAFGITVTFVDAPGMAERATYFGNPLFSGGHDAAGVTEPSTTWLFAEGATGRFFTTFILVANPGDEPAEVTARFLPDRGDPVTRTFTLPARRRHTINIAGEDAALAAGAVATEIRSTVPVMAERAMYWPGGPETWYEAHASAGLTSAGLKWGLAEGRVGGPERYQTFILLANPGDEPAAATLTFLRQNGTTVVKNFTVPPNARFNVNVATDVPELRDEGFGTVVASDKPLGVERALYADVDGVSWAAGTNATGTRLP